MTRARGIPTPPWAWWALIVNTSPEPKRARYLVVPTVHLRGVRWTVVDTGTGTALARYRHREVARRYAETLNAGEKGGNQ